MSSDTQKLIESIDKILRSQNLFGTTKRSLAKLWPSSLTFDPKPSPSDKATGYTSFGLQAPPKLAVTDLKAGYPAYLTCRAQLTHEKRRLFDGKVPKSARTGRKNSSATGLQFTVAQSLQSHRPHSISFELLGMWVPSTSKHRAMVIF